MSWKSDKKTGRAWSFTVWLTLLNTAAAACVLTLIAALLYFGLARQLKSQNHSYLHDEVDIIERLVRSEGYQDDFQEEVLPDHAGEEYVKHYVRLLDRNGAILAETPGMAEVAPITAFPKVVRDGRPGIDKSWRSGSGAKLLGTAVWLDLGKGSGEQGVLQVALDVTNVGQVLKGYLNTIYALLVPGFLLCVALSFAVARRGTKPLREMTELVQLVTVANLEERIAGEKWPRELYVLADAMNMMLDRLDDSFKRLYNSATNLSHKMRTPLTILKGEAEVALSRSRTVEELQEVISSSLEENNRLCRLGDNILFLANAELGKFHVTLTSVQLRNEVEKVIDYYYPLAEDKGITFSCQGRAVATVDAALFRKACSALISNCFTYGDDGNMVRLELRQCENGGAELKVVDNGCGIEACELPKVFDRFYRIYATRYKDPHGTGLGLPIVKAIMELHQGWVRLESAPGAGTTVTLTFPLRDGHTFPAGDTSAAEA